jgi:hypothetical protein
MLFVVIKFLLLAAFLGDLTFGFLRFFDILQPGAAKYKGEQQGRITLKRRRTPSQDLLQV